MSVDSEETLPKLWEHWREQSSESFAARSAVMHCRKYYTSMASCLVEVRVLGVSGREGDQVTTPVEGCTRVNADARTLAHLLGRQHCIVKGGEEET